MILSKSSGEVRAISGSSGSADASGLPVRALQASLTCSQP